MWKRLVQVVRRAQKIENSPVGGKVRLRKTVGQTIKRDLEVNSLSLSLIHERHCGII